MLRGNVLAKIDDKGRLKLPTHFRSIIEPDHGREFFVTSIRGESALLYPVPVYHEFERRLIESSKLEPLVSRLRNAINYFGQSATMDGQGRVLVHPLLREAAGIHGEVAVLGQQNYLEIWNRDAFTAQLESKPLTDDELRELAHLGF